MNVNFHEPLNVRREASSSSCEAAVKIVAYKQKYKILRRFFVKFHVDLLSGVSVAACVQAGRLMVTANFSRNSTEMRTCLKTDGANETRTISKFLNIHNSWDLCGTSGFESKNFQTIRCICISSNTTIQGVSRLEDITAGGNFLGICDKKKFI